MHYICAELSQSRTIEPSTGRGRKGLGIGRWDPTDKFLFYDFWVPTTSLVLRGPKDCPPPPHLAFKICMGIVILLLKIISKPTTGSLLPPCIFHNFFIKPCCRREGVGAQVVEQNFVDEVPLPIQSC